MKKIIIAGAAFFSFHFAIAESMSGEALIQSLTKVRSALKASAGSTVACETPQSDTCEFAGYCGKFAERAGDFYLYKDSEGRTVPNTQLLGALGMAEFCAKNPFPQAAVQDPFVYVDQFLSAEKAGGEQQLKKNRALLKQSEQRVEKIFKDMQLRVIRMVESRRTPQNSAAIDNIVGRIKSVVYKSVDLQGTYAYVAAQGCTGPNAFYNPDGHAITVCPQSLNMPEAALFSVMAHEIAHAFGPCAMTMGRNQKGLILPDWMEGGRTADKELAAPVFMDQNPYKSVVACLQGPKSLGVKIPSVKDLIADVDSFEKSLKDEMREMAEGENDQGEGLVDDATTARFEDERQKIKANYNKFKYCSELTRSGHISEAFSDWIASEAIAEKIKEIPEASKKKEFAFASQAHFYGTACANVMQAGLNKIRSATQGACPALEEFMQTLHSPTPEPRDMYSIESHPQTDQRVDRIYYAKPELREALGCKGGNHGQPCK